MKQPASRLTPTLKRPPDRADALRDFPCRIVATDQALYRVVRSGRLPWWFGSTMDGRFDLALPKGTCYVAQEALAALLEVIGPGPVTPEFVAARRLRTLFVPQPREVADTCARRASRYGVTAEIGTIVPYNLPQAWAHRLDQAGFGGVAYWLRHDPARARGYAFFGKAGDRRRWRRGHERAIAGPLMRHLHREHGITIYHPPSASQLRFVD